MFPCEFIAAATILFVYVVEAGIGPFDLSQDPRHSPAPIESGLVEGDFKLTEKQKVNMKLFKNVYGPPERAASGRESERWPGAIIPYVFDCSVTNMPTVISSVKEAMAEWEKRTCIRFVQKTDQKNYLEFFRAGGCWASYVGYQSRKTQVSIGDGCDYKHVMVHELGHVIGFWHEQSRRDRDYYIQIIWENIIESMKYNFDKVVDGAVDSVGEPYDYGSIMHYPFNAFSKDWNKDTIVPRRPLNGKKPYVELSDSDARQANIMYKCSVVARKRMDKLRQLQRSPMALSADASCVDDHETCPIWAEDGHCVKAANPLLRVCKKSCRNCGPCADESIHCKVWANHRQCYVNPSYMWRHCKVSCRVCNPGPSTPSPPTTTRQTTRRPSPTTSETNPPTNSTNPPTKPTINPPSRPKYRGIKCVDRDSRCPKWAANGYCKTDAWAKRNCFKSCRRTDICDETQPRPSGSCAEPLGLGWDRTLPDNAFQASTDFRPGGGWVAGARNARLYMRDDHTDRRIGAWCADYGHSRNQWLKIDLGKVRRVTAVATQGRDRFYEHVKSYELSFSVDGSTWQKYKENDIIKEFTGNCDHITPVINNLSSPVRAQYVMFHPKKYLAGVCMRTEIYGCNI